MPDTPRPRQRSAVKLSIIVTSYNAEATIAACLTALRDQQTAVTHEVIVVDSSTDHTAERVARGFPWVTLLTQPRRTYCGEARNIGIAASRGELIAFMDADCTMRPDWVDRVVAAHATDHLAVAGVIENSRASSGALGWAYYFCELNLWLPRHRRREIGEAAGSCLSLRREVYDRYGPFLTGCYSSDTLFQRKMARDGHRILQDPTIRVFHTATHGPWEFLEHLYIHRRDFARVNARARRLSRAQRLLMAACCPALPPVLLLVIGGRVSASSVPLWRFLGCSPVVLAGLVARAAGELAGYLHGPPGP